MNSRVALTALCLSSVFFSGCMVEEEYGTVESEVEPVAIKATESAQLDDIETELMNLEITEEDFSDL